MSYGKELWEETLIDENVWYMQVCDRLDLLLEEKKMRKLGGHIEGVWTTKDGQEIPFSEMTDSHLDNAIRYFEQLVD